MLTLNRREHRPLQILNEVEGGRLGVREAAGIPGHLTQFDVTFEMNLRMTHYRFSHLLLALAS
jgi:hypothetical protein